ncbi:RNA polymerase sigma factor [Chitinophaga deserti]|uniref:RNA polymerase sigma factor n=1 Tax=Chitinophaga deserti TaxID=2164099 RepID=UPI000D6D3FD0|nr:RNA polymerase sigma-70 factor [Chitinophaga deserti]
MEQLLERIAKNSDQLAFGQLFSHFSDRLIYFASALVRSREEAEEVVADVFVKLWQNRSQLLEIRHFQTYVYTAVRNTALNHRSRSIFPIEELEGNEAALIPCVVSPEESLISRENLRQIEQAVNGLPIRCRLIFKLVKEDGLSYREVAEVLDISVNTVNAQITIALKKLSSAIDLRKPFRIPLVRK